MAAQNDRPGGVAVCPLAVEDVLATARLHSEALPEGFFVRLGARFLAEYHRTYVASPHAVALGLRCDGGIDGFLLATLDPAAHGAWVLRRAGARLLLAGAVALVVRPRVLALFLRTRAVRYARGVLRRVRRVPAAQDVSTAGWAVLSHIAVAPERRGTGAAAALVRELHCRAITSGAAGVLLLTAPSGPGPRFYAKLGYRSDGLVRGADGSSWLRFRHRLVR